MKLTIEINLDNSAYDNIGWELGENLQNVIDRIGSGITDGTIYDVNGNRTGYFNISGDK